MYPLGYTDEMNVTVKERATDLAIFGHSPAFAKPLHVGTPNIGSKQRFMERVSDLLERRYLTNSGPYVQEFEKRLSDFLGVKHVLAMCNATVAIEIATRALGMK